MKITYDKESDCKYIALTTTHRKGAVTTTKEIKDWLLADYSSKGNLLGIEILNASINDGTVFISNGEVSYQEKSNLVMMPASFAVVNLPINARVHQQAAV